MHLQSWLLIVAALLVALPFGFLLGMLIAWVVAGRSTMVGMIPIMTIPPAVIAALVFALVPVFTAGTRLTTLAIGAVLMAIALAIIVTR